MPTLNRNTNKRDTIQAWLNAIDQANHEIFPNQHSAPHLNHSSSPSVGAAAAAATVVLFSKSLYSAIALSRFLIANFHSS
mmetsp:Transcript_14349/g.26934  ORF Transcript_14349/g.26934 Transcript_14349/m.26934 type:complete len:80 (+) Transcript_14349:106-345(+)